MANSTRVKGITIEIGGDTTGLDKALEGVDKQLNSTQSQLRDVNKLLKLDPTNTTLLAQKQRLLTSAIGTTSDRLKALKDAQKQLDDQIAAGGEKNVEQYEALQREIIETENKLKGFQSEQAGLAPVAKQAETLDTNLKSVTKSATLMKGAIVGAATAAGKSMLELIASTPAMADELNTLAKQTGFSTDELQKFAYASELVDVSQEAIISSARRLKMSMKSSSEEVATAFNRLGVSIKDTNGEYRDATDVYYDVLQGLSKIGNETERDTLALTLFGKGADELAGIIDDGGAALKAFGDEAERIGAVISATDLEKLNEINDVLDRLKTQWGAYLKISAGELAIDFVDMITKPGEYWSGVGQKFEDAQTALYNYNHPTDTGATHVSSSGRVHGGGGSFGSSSESVNVNVSFNGDLAAVGAALAPSVEAELVREGKGGLTR